MTDLLAMTPRQFLMARRLMDLSRGQLAAILGLGRHGVRTIQRWEAGERDIPQPAIRELCRLGKLTGQQRADLLDERAERRKKIVGNVRFLFDE